MPADGFEAFSDFSYCGMVPGTDNRKMQSKIFISQLSEDYEVIRRLEKLPMEPLRAFS